MAKVPSRTARLFTAVFRILIFTVLFTALGMGLGLFFGIIGSIIYGAIKHANVDMAMAYRSVAVPIALISGGCAFLYNTLVTLRRAVRGA